MASGSKDNQQAFGLILNPAKRKQQLLLKKAIFDDEDNLDTSSSEDESNGEANNLRLPVRNQDKPLYPGRSSNAVQSVVDKALEEDPNVFAYDEVYDDIKAEKEAKSAPKSTKPRYMNSLLKSAELRKRENERREERKIQKEREEEGDEFADKEAFITPAYKEKLEELKKTEEREKKEAAFEKTFDVTKQQDMSGFYRHLLNQTVGEEKVSLHSISDRFEGEDDPAVGNNKFNQIKKTNKPRQMRQRKDSSSSEEEDDKSNEQKDAKIGQSSFNKDKKKEKDERSDQKESKIKKETTSDSEKGSKELSKNKCDADGSIVEAKKTVPGEESKDKPPGEGKDTSSVDKEESEKAIPKVDRRILILEKFKKRTVGQVFDEARARYLERKANAAGLSASLTSTTAD